MDKIEIPKDLLEVLIREIDGILISKKDGVDYHRVNTNCLLRDLKILLINLKNQEPFISKISLICLQNIIKRYSKAYILRLIKKG